MKQPGGKETKGGGGGAVAGGNGDVEGAVITTNFGEMVDFGGGVAGEPMIVADGPIEANQASASLPGETRAREAQVHKVVRVDEVLEGGASALRPTAATRTVSRGRVAFQSPAKSQGRAASRGTRGRSVQRDLRDVGVGLPYTGVK